MMPGSDQTPDPNDPAYVLIPREDLEGLIVFGQNCSAALGSCAQAVEDLNNYKTQADQQINDLTNSLQVEQAKPHLQWWWIPISILLGGAAGALIFHHK